jgi:hypothetical protein
VGIYVSILRNSIHFGYLIAAHPASKTRALRDGRRGAGEVAVWGHFLGGKSGRKKTAQSWCLRKVGRKEGRKEQRGADVWAINPSAFAFAIAAKKEQKKMEKCLRQKMPAALASSGAFFFAVTSMPSTWPANDLSGFLRKGTRRLN